MTNGADAIVEIAGLSIATLGGKRVIDDLSIEILAGENRALVGESGSGKTTLALALMGRIRSRPRPRGRNYLSSTGRTCFLSKAYR